MAANMPVIGARITAVLLCTLLLGGSACLTRPDALYCDEMGAQCTAGYICDLTGELPASGGHGNTCVATGKSCSEPCKNPTPICEARACQSCMDSAASCPETSHLCRADGACVECLQRADCSSGLICDTDGRCIPPCTGPANCPDAARPWCGSGAYCVQCTGDAHCPGGEVCDNETCVPCTTHSRCASGICDDSDRDGRGVCIAPERVTYVATAGSSDDSECGSRESPCRSVGFALGRGTSWLRLAAGTYTESLAITLDGRSMTLVGEEDTGGAPAVTVKPSSGASPVVLVQGSATRLSIDNMIITGANQADFGVKCLESARVRLYRTEVTAADFAGVVAKDGCDLTMERVIVNHNEGGGVVIDNASFTVQSSVIIANAGLGLERKSSAAGQRKELYFNTIVDNSEGLRCDQPIAASHNILWNNTAETDAEIGDCFATGTIEDDYSLIRWRDRVNAGWDWTSDGYHLGSSSPAINRGAGDPPGVALDFDGEPRPNPDDGVNIVDIGADEYYPSSP